MEAPYKSLENFWKDYAEAFSHPLTSNSLLGKFVNNPNVTGAYAESWLRSITASMLSQFRISTGTIIRPSDRLRPNPSNPQCDLIVWDPSELPALFESGDFAIVPNFSVRAIIEIKRTLSNIQYLKEQLDLRRKYLPVEFNSNVLGVVISHGKSLFEGEVNAEWLKSRSKNDDPPITRLLDNNTGEADHSGVLAFIYFLSQIAGHGWASKTQ